VRTPPDPLQRCASGDYQAPRYWQRQETPEEQEAFNQVERNSKVKQEILRNPSKETKLLLEVALLTDLVRQLADRVRQLEGKQ